jgi:hypothetical protein
MRKMKKSLLMIMIIVTTVFYPQMILAEENGLADLSQYPDQFIRNDAFDGTLVIGMAAPSIDVMAVTNIGMGLQAELKTSMPSTATKFDKDITNPKSMNLIVVGTPCKNKVTSELLDNIDDCSYGVTPGYARIKLISSNNRYQLLMYGASNDDTNKASQIIQNYKNYRLRGNDIIINTATGEIKDFDKEHYVADTSTLPSNQNGTKSPVQTNEPANMPEIQKDECSSNFDCNDNDISTNDNCAGTPKKCTHTKMTACVTGDNYCPNNCKYSEDKECDECLKDEDCGNKDACSIKSCQGTPKRCSYQTQNGCDINSVCAPIGTRTESEYCDISNKLISQKTKDKDCSNNYECSLNICENSKCIQPGVFRKMMMWFGNLFG